MATISQSDSRRAYSWLWDSHICPKNSKWLQENLTDMDLKVKSMIKLIEEDADSFARRAEMYYKKRPELMKLVEEFYRAYRALAERYNHATGELHHAHRTIAKAFPDQDFPFELINDDLPSKLLPQDKDLKTSSTKEDDAIQLSNENQNLKGQCLQESGRAGRAESEIQGLKKVLADVKAAREDVLIQYHQCVEKLSNVEEELHNARKDSTRLNENAERAEIEVQVLKEALVQLETEKNAGLVKQRIYLEKISSLEAMLGQFQEDIKGLNERATWSESEAQNLQDEISRLQLEKEDMLRKYKQCLERILVLENLTYVAEKNAKEFQMQAEKAENEVCQLKMSLADMKKEKEDLAIKYKCCLETISKLEKDLSSEREDLKRLNKDALIRNLKLKNSEDKCTLLENSNLSLRDEADQLAKKIAMKDQELSQKQEELENLQKNLLDELSHHAHVEATLQNLQSLHSQSQDDQKVLTVELQKALQMLNDLEVNRCVLEEEIKQVRDENQSLNQKNLSSAASVNTMRNEMLSLRDVKDRLEKEVSYHTALSDSLQMEISSLKEEVESLNARYKALLEQVEASGLSPRSFKSSVKELRDENEMLRQTCEQGSCEKEFMSKKLQNMEDQLKKKVVAESSLADLNSELESSREKVKVLQELFHCLDGEKATLVTEKASLLSQLQAITENMHNLLGKNAVLENTLFAAKVKLEGLREKSKGLEGICEMLKDERSHILAERGMFVLKLEDVERRLKNMERKCSSLEAKYTDLHMEKEAMRCKAEELAISLNMERQERTNLGMMNETKLAGLEHQIRVLREEDNWKRKEFEDELDRSLKSQFEISILQRFMKDMEEKNHSLVVECQKHVEASKLADKVISELESESHEQQVEAGLLLDEIERLRFGIYNLFRAIETCADKKIEDEQTVVNHILAFIDNMKRSISKHEDCKQLLLVENSVLLTLLEQLEAKAMDVEGQKVCLECEFEIMAEKLSLAKKEKDQLLGMNAKLKSDVSKSHQHNDLLEAELDGLRVKETELNKAYLALQEAYSQVNQENKEMLQVFSDLKDEKYQVEQHDDTVLLECMSRGNESVFLHSFAEEKVKQLSLLLGDLNRQHEMNNGLRKETRALMEKLNLPRAENSLLNETVQKLEMETKGLKEYNAQMKEDILSGTETLLQTQGKLLVKELKLEAAENMNSKLCRTVEELKSEVQDSLQTRHDLEKSLIQLSDANSAQRKEIEGLHIVNTNLKSKLGMLREEINEKTVSKKALISELEKKKNEFELWEAEAVPFYFDLQFLSINEILIKDKVQELTEVSQTLKDENNSKMLEIVQLRGKIRSMESEISGLKCQLDAYGPVIAALKDDITLLEHNALLQKNIEAAHGQEQEFSEGATDPSRSSSEIFIEDQTLLSLQDLVIRIKAVSKLMEDTNTPISHRTTSNKSKQETKSETEQLKLSHLVGRDKNEPTSRRRRGYKIELSDTPKLLKIKTKSPSDVRNRDLMKDIHQLSDGSLHRTSKNIQEDDKIPELSDIRRDQTIGESLKMSYKMIERGLTHDRVEDSNPNSKNPSTDSDMERESGVDSLELLTRSKKPNRETNRARIMERLTCDAEELEILQKTVETLRKKVEGHKRSRKAKNLDFDSVHDQLLESEETVVSLMDMNNRLMKSIEECPSPNENVSPKSKDDLKTRRRRIAEQARKVSEKIFRLQLEIQKIQCMLLEFEDEKGKKKLFKSKAIVLRDLIYNGVTKRNKKSQLCGCIRPSTTQNGHS